MSSLLVKFGTFLVIISFGVIVVIMSPSLIEEIKYAFVSGEVSEVAISEEDSGPKTIVVADKDFSVIVPKIGANAKVIANVNPYDSNEYQAKLTQGVAHADGTKKPGELGNTFLFAHSTDNFYNANRYNSVFYLLRKLELDDEFYVAYDNEIYKYNVTETSIVEPDAVEYLQGDPSKETVTLMTCWPPGTTLQRLLVVGELVKTN